jgi:hypothetical protein
MGTDRQTDRNTDDTEANTIVRSLYLFITIVIRKEGRTKKLELSRVYTTLGKTN